MGNSASSLPYSIGSQVTTAHDGWVLHEGQKKSDGSKVSVFVAKKPQLNKQSLLAPAQHHFTTCKRFKHPHILTVEATLDTDESSSSSSNNGDLIIVTETCTPLDTWLSSDPPPECVAWGLECIIRGLSFLHTSGMLHGNVSPNSFMVTPAGDVKIWNLSLASPADNLTHFQQYEHQLTPQPYRSPERQSRAYDQIQAHTVDSYSLAVLIDHIYESHIPPPLVKAVQRMQTQNPKMRPRLSPLLKCPLFDTPYQKLQLELEEFTVQAIEDKIQFWQNLNPQLQAQLIPKHTALYKLLPLMQQTVATTTQSDVLRQQDIYRKELTVLLQPFFSIAQELENFSTVTGSIALLFSVADRGVRGGLLQKAGIMAERLDRGSINQAVFEPMCSGFSDSSAALRELTLQATLGLVPHLTPPNVEKLSRYLVRLQQDPEANIRTNTMYFFANVAPQLSEVTRQKLLIPAIGRALQDPHPPVRLAALSTIKTKQLFPPKIIASKALPIITPCLLDTSAQVRKAAFKVVDELLFLLRQESERLNQQPSEEDKHLPAQQQKAPQGTQKTAKAPSSGGGGYFSSWVSSATQPQNGSSGPASAAAPPSAVPAPLSAPMTTTGAHLEDDNGWGDDFGDELDISSGGGDPSAPQAMNSSLFSPQADDGDDFFNGFNKPAKPAGTNPKGKLVVPKKAAATKPAVQKLSVNDDVADGWDDF